MDKFYINGKISMISFGVSFFSDVHARQRVALNTLLKYYIVVFGVLSNRRLLIVVLTLYRRLLIVV